MNRYPAMFGIFTLILLLLSGVFIYVTRVEDAASLPHVPDPNWSSARAVTPTTNLISSQEFAVDEEGRLFVFWGETDPNDKVSQITYQIVNTKGKAISEPKVLVRDLHSWDIAVTIHEKAIHLFWAGKNDGDKSDLRYTRYNLDGELLKEEIVLRNAFAQVGDLMAAVTPEGNFMVGWLNQYNRRFEGNREVVTLFVNADGVAQREPVTLATTENDHFALNLISDAKGRFHVSWLEKVQVPYYSMTLTRRNIYYQGFDSKGNAVDEPRYIDESKDDQVGLAVKDDTLFLVWNKIFPVPAKTTDSHLKSLLDNNVIYGTTIDLNYPAVPLEISMLSPERGPFINQVITTDTQGQIHLVFVSNYKELMALTHMVFGKDFTDLVKAPKRIYPEQRLIEYQTTAKLIPDPKKGVHLVWKDADRKGKCYLYANTTKEGRITPLQVIGLNTSMLGVSFIMSLGYSLFLPVAHVLAGLTFFAIFPCAFLLWGINRGLQKLRITSILGNRYLAPALTILTLCLFYARMGVWHAFFASYFPTTLETVFVLGTASLATLLFIKLNKISDQNLPAMIGMATLWLLWVNMMCQVFTLPGWNYFMSI